MSTIKNKRRVAIIWIILYVVLIGTAQSLDLDLQYVGLVSAPVSLVMAIGLTMFLSRRQALDEYGLWTPTDFPWAKALYCLPLLVLATSNIWFGVTLKFSLPETVLYVLSMLCVGYLEEVIFRSFLLQALLVKGARIAIVVSSLTFGLGHILNLLNGAEVLPTLLQIIYAVVLGVMLSVLALKTGNIIPGILFHAIFNALSAFTDEAAISDLDLIRLCVIITVVSLGYSLWLWRRFE